MILISWCNKTMEAYYFAYVNKNIPGLQYAVEIPRQACKHPGCPNTFKIGGPYCEDHTHQIYGVKWGTSPLYPTLLNRGVIATRGRSVKKSQKEDGKPDPWLPYSAEYITEVEEDRRYGKKYTKPYTLSLGSGGGKIDGVKYQSQDGARIRAIGTMVNHPPDGRVANVIFIKHKGCLWLEAIRDIKKGDELWADYHGGGPVTKDSYHFDEPGVYFKDVHATAGPKITVSFGDPFLEESWSVKLDVVNWGQPVMPKEFPLKVDEQFEKRMGPVEGRVSLLLQRVDVMAESQSNGYLARRDVFHSYVPEESNDVPMEDVDVSALMPNSVPIEER